MDELAHGVLHRLRLILHLLHLDADRQLRADALHRGAQVLAELDDVAALGHRDAQPDHLLAVEAHLGARRIDVAVPDGGDVAQANIAGAAGAAQGQVLQVADVRELAGQADLHVVRRRDQHAAGADVVLLRDLVGDAVDVQPHLRELGLLELDVDLLVLVAEQGDLGDVGHAQQLLADRIGVVVELAIGEAVGGQRIDGAVHIAEIIVEVRSTHAGRQRRRDIAHLLAHRVPELLRILGRRGVGQLEGDERLAGLGIAADLPGVWHFLQRLFDLVGHLARHLLGGRAGPERLHHHRAEGEGRVFVLTELGIGEDAAEQQRHQQEAGQRLMLERPA